MLLAISDVAPEVVMNKVGRSKFMSKVILKKKTGTIE
jgi:hypothetical protein